MRTICAPVRSGFWLDVGIFEPKNSGGFEARASRTDIEIASKRVAMKSG